MLPTLLAVNLGDEYKLNPKADTTVAEFFGKPAQFLNVLLPNVYIAAGLVILFLLVFGGLSIIMSSGDSKGVDKGKQALTSAAIGFMIVFTSYWLIQLLELLTGVKILSPSNL
jgi:hypothetical protein